MLERNIFWQRYLQQIHAYGWLVTSLLLRCAYVQSNATASSAARATPAFRQQAMRLLKMYLCIYKYMYVNKIMSST